MTSHQVQKGSIFEREIKSDLFFFSNQLTNHVIERLWSALTSDPHVSEHIYQAFQQNSSLRCAPTIAPDDFPHVTNNLCQN